MYHESVLFKDYQHDNEEKQNRNPEKKRLLADYALRRYKLMNEIKKPMHQLDVSKRLGMYVEIKLLTHILNTSI